MRKVTINGKEWNLAYNLRSLFLYEQISGHPYTGGKTMDNYMLLYAMLQANNDEFSMTADEFIDACDEDMGIFQVFVEVMEDYTKRVSAFVENKKKAVMQ
jgi:hypothetical protein